jgi:sporulation protein YlmC with PRC-barrel domain
MLAKYTVAGLAGTVLLASVAFAQSPSAPSSDSTTKMAPAASNTSTSPSSFTGNWRASKVVGLSVYNDKNESVGSINDVLMDKSGKIVAVVIGVGGFLGVGEHLVAVPFEKVKFSTEPVAYTGTAAGGGAGGAGGARPGGSTTTTGAATTGGAAASKPNPWYPDHAVFNATKDELKAMPEFKYST